MKAKGAIGLIVVLFLSATVSQLCFNYAATGQISGPAYLEFPAYSSFHRVGYYAYYWDGEKYMLPNPNMVDWRPATPVAFDLQSHGFVAGDIILFNFNSTQYYAEKWWNLSAHTPQSWVDQNDPHLYPDSYPYGFYGVFSSSSLVLDDVSLLNRVPGAISAGIDSKTFPIINIISGWPAETDLPSGWPPSKPAGFMYNNVDTDIPQDFAITNDFEVQIPEGAKYLIFGNHPNSVQVGNGGAYYVSIERDSDGDSFPDSWEEDGLDVNNDGEIDLNLPLMGADSMHKDIFVEVDYMGSTSSCSGHKPDSLALDDVEKAFRNSPVSNPDGVKGVNLHVVVDEELTHVNGLAGWGGFNTLKSNHFGTVEDRNDTNKANILEAWKRVYHYCLFIHQWQGSEASGVAELPGNDFMVSLGNFTTNPGTRDEQAATFMHELGHNLGLRHGGSDDIMYKPNYLSIMNYLFQFEDPVAGRPLDYSVRELITLNESALSEDFGIGGLPGDNTAFSLPPGNFYGVPVGLVDGSLSIDWNGNGTTDAGVVVANINNYPTWDKGASGLDQSLKGHNDWANLNFDFRSTSDYADGVHNHVINETMTPALLEEIRTTSKIIIDSQPTPPPIIPENPTMTLTVVAITIVTVLLLAIKKTGKSAKPQHMP